MSDDCELPEAYVEKTVKAIKDHQCCECRGTIKAGERYTLHSGIWSGEPASYKICADCTHLRCEISKMDDDGCVAFGQLREEVLNNNDSDRLVAAFNAYSKVRGGKLLPVDSSLEPV